MARCRYVHSVGAIAIASHQPRATSHPGPPRHALTLVEMLIAMALTLLMMAAVVSVFANVSKSVANRRSAIEMTSQVRHVRNVLQLDLTGATCPGIPWQRTDSNHGYIEIIEGPQSDFDPSVWLRDRNNDGQPDPIAGGAIDLATSTLPGTNLARLPGAATTVTSTGLGSVTDGGALGDWDDILMLTVRNEDQPFTGLVPSSSIIGTGIGFPAWGSEPITSTLAEVVWFAVENPVTDADNAIYFGEPGFRTLYRRTLLIAPWLNYRFQVPGPGGPQLTGPGVVRVLADGATEVQALAAIVAFQERYDLSVRIEFDRLLGVNGRWKIVANSLADLTKRENRYEHHGYFVATGGPAARRFPFVSASSGAYSGDVNLGLVSDPTMAGSVTAAAGRGRVDPAGRIAAYEVTDQGEYSDPGATDSVDDDAHYYRPFVWVNQPVDPTNYAPVHATPRAITALIDRDNGERTEGVVGFTSGLVPLGGARRGEDVMLTDALAFDLRVYDPQAPVLAEIKSSSDPNFPGSALEPGDAGWGTVLKRDGFGAAQNRATVISRGAYVDLGYYRLHQEFFNLNEAIRPWPTIQPTHAADLVGESPLADRPHLKSQMRAAAPTIADQLDAFRVYDTWSFHYENNGLNEDIQNDNGLTQIDEATNGFDDDDWYPNFNPPPSLVFEKRIGPDDKGERETSPPYDVRLRGVQVTLRAHENDSRQIREVKVHQTFVPK